MQVKEVTVFSFDELSEEAKQYAIGKEREGADYSHLWDEMRSTVEAFCNLFNVKTGNRSWLEYEKNFDDSIAEMTGVRLMKWILNNHVLWKRKTLKFINGKHIVHPYVNAHRKDYKGEPYSIARSRIKKDNSYILTGMCYDYTVMKPIYDFIARPDNSDWYDLLDSCFHEAREAIEEEIEYRESDEAIIEDLNDKDAKYSADGREFWY